MSSFKLNNDFTIKVYTGSILDRKLECEAITISIFKKSFFEQKVGLVKAAIATFGSNVKKNFEKEIKKLPKNFELEGQCIVVETGKKKPKYLFNIVLDSIDPKNSTKFESLMKKSLENFFESLNHSNEIKSIAIPLLGTGFSSGPVNSSINILLDRVLDFHNKGKMIHLKELHLVNIEEFKTQLIVKKLKEILNENAAPIAHNLEPQLIKKKEDNRDELECACKLNDNIFQKEENLHNKENLNIDTKQCSWCKQKLKNVKLIDCGHLFCPSCCGDIKENKIKCLIPDCSHNNDKTNIDVVEENKIEKTCEICCEIYDSLKVLEKCGHELCTDCFKRLFESKPQCPFCFTFYGIPKGIQPSDGKMSVITEKFSLPGYEEFSTIVINYRFPPGRQTEDHPNPGKNYSGSHRTAYLPGTEEGFKAQKLLEKAFENRLIFTIGTSVTTGIEGITWNDIHHKTQIRGPYGYPDKDYLKRLFEELKSHGIE